MGSPKVSMQLQTLAQIKIQAPIERVFDGSIDCQNLPVFFTGYRAIPAIVSAITTDGLPLHPGSTRIVHNSDGSAIAEKIVALQRPTRQDYQLVDGFKPPFSWLVESAGGTWIYQATPNGTEITWQFLFQPRNILAALILRMLLLRPFQTAQHICLTNLKQWAEHR